jgi:predicted amidohydrolase YtcJ
MKKRADADSQNGETHIREGDRADLVILHNDPLKCNAAGLRAMKVLGTLLGGNWTFRR